MDADQSLADDDGQDADVGNEDPFTFNIEAEEELQAHAVDMPGFNIQAAAGLENLDETLQHGGQGMPDVRPGGKDEYAYSCQMAIFIFRSLACSPQFTFRCG